jgi:hypothetical protein
MTHPDASLLELDSLRYAMAGNAEPGHPFSNVLYLRRVKTLIFLYLDSPGEVSPKWGF